LRNQEYDFRKLPDHIKQQELDHKTLIVD